VVCGDRPGKNASSQVTVSGGITMTVSERESQEMAQRDSERLFRQRRLSLVLDLDHTLVHATSDARARQYLVQHDDVRTIRLPVLEGAPPGTAVDPQHANMFAQHYVKLRPHINEFLKGIQSTYEVSVYTAGTRQYAEEITMVLCRSLVGSKRDIDDIEHLRYRVKMAKQEYSKHSQLNDDKKRKIEQLDDMDVGGDETKRPKKRKKISFGFSEAGNDEDTQKSDHMTKDKLENMQTELRLADELEIKARDLRQAIFGSRVFSRTDVGDLGRDVKSLKRIFPCGGTMAAVVDDREDVWANAKDNSEITIKGEPPDNLLLVRPYHWQPFVGFADINNASGADLSVSDSANDGDLSSERDVQLLWTKEILEKLHDHYYRDSDKGSRQSVPETLKKMRLHVLRGSRLVLSGLVPLHKQESFGPNAPRPPIVRYAQSLGAKVRLHGLSTCDSSCYHLTFFFYLVCLLQIQNTVDYSTTHVVAAKDGSEKSMAARMIPGCALVKPGWLMESYWSMSKCDETPFLMGKGPGELPKKQGVLKELNMENSTDGSTDSDDDDLAAEFEDEMMNG
jgi:RNA polymerase II subunit A-like phosphatase